MGPKAAQRAPFLIFAAGPFNPVLELTNSNDTDTWVASVFHSVYIFALSKS